MQIVLDSVQCTDFGVSSQREWLVTNGIGGYASSTVAGANTRRYHGLLVAALVPPTDRFVLVSSLDAKVELSGQEFLLNANQYPDAVYPQGYLHLQKFLLNPEPSWYYGLPGNSTLIKRVWMAHGQNTTYVTYELQGNKPIRLTLSPLIAYKNYHEEMHPRPGFPLDEKVDKETITITYDKNFPPLKMMAPNATITETEVWYYQFEHLRERERGLDSLEDLYNPIACSYYLTPGERAVMIFTTELKEVETDVDAALSAERKRLADLVALSGLKDPVAQLIAQNCDAFLVKAPDRTTVIAGYPWFTDWGRDTMIALPGLCLTTKRYDEARDILLSFAKHVNKGLIPNRFPGEGQPPEYNTVDATLWYANSIYKYLSIRWDLDFALVIMPVLCKIFIGHCQSSLYNVIVEKDGLLSAGEPGVQLTWMDAKVGDWVVTPRIGKPVEINALWINFLRIMEWLAGKLGQPTKEYEQAASLAELSFREKFWYEEKGYFYDVISDGPPDTSLRPNQVLAISLPFAPAAKEQAESVIEVIQSNLLTPYGLRTLSPDDPSYIGTYSGSQASRDAAYHQGTVWPWLMGPFIEAYIAVTKDRPGARRMMVSLREHLKEAGMGYISEIFDGDPPHHPVGCIAQAWSQAEMLRVWVEELGTH